MITNPLYAFRIQNFLFNRIRIFSQFNFLFNCTWVPYSYQRFTVSKICITEMNTTKIIIENPSNETSFQQNVLPQSSLSCCVTKLRISEPEFPATTWRQRATNIEIPSGLQTHSGRANTSRRKSCSRLSFVSTEVSRLTNPDVFRAN